MSDDQNSNKVLKFQDVELSPQQQEQLNQPLKDDSGVTPEDTQFLTMLVDKIEKKEIDLYTPSSLFNVPVYEKLAPEAQAQADLDAFNLLATIREINGLWKAGQRDTYQIQYLASKIRMTKERIEEVGGDIFII